MKLIARISLADGDYNSVHPRRKTRTERSLYFVAV
jgi:hypothetical protein